MISALLESSNQALDIADIVYKQQMVEYDIKQQTQHMTEQALVACHCGRHPPLRRSAGIVTETVVSAGPYPGSSKEAALQLPHPSTL